MRYFIANWKMYKTPVEAQEFVRIFLTLGKLPKNREVCIAPSAPLLAVLAPKLQKTPFKLCGQNMYFEDKGAFTGESSPQQLKALGCKYVILGHSERRQLFGETNQIIAKKVSAAWRHHLIPIICLGETLSERRVVGKAKKVVKKQLEECILASDAEMRQTHKFIVAYEPVWAIGTGQNATPAQAQEMHQFIRQHLTPRIPILYGGSVKPENSRELLKQKDVDGFLIGSASLDPKSFWKIINE